jgi:hypothetical protein
VQIIQGRFIERIGYNNFQLALEGLYGKRKRQGCGI